MNNLLVTDLFRRITDRSFLLTLTVLIMSQIGNWTPEQTFAGIGTIAPFIFGEKFKDAAIAKASNPIPETVNAGGDVTVNETPTERALPKAEGRMEMPPTMYRSTHTPITGDEAAPDDDGTPSE